jgi:hypothetical protein
MTNHFLEKTDDDALDQIPLNNDLGMTHILENLISKRDKRLRINVPRASLQNCRLSSVSPLLKGSSII